MAHQAATPTNSPCLPINPMPWTSVRTSFRQAPSNNGAASVPSSVAVPAGATSATFPVNTRAVAASTTVTISAAYGGVSKSATLTVTPPPLPTLSSLTLNPTSVIGGVQSSTGTVTLSAPAPAGGAQVALSR